MHQRVSLQVTAGIASEIAIFAFVWLFASVSAQMFLQITTRCTTVRTLITSKGLFSSMRAHVQLQVASGFTNVVTLITSPRCFTSVNAHVPFQRDSRVASVVTFFTSKWFFTGVLTRVLGPCARARDTVILIWGHGAVRLNYSLAINNLGRTPSFLTVLIFAIGHSRQLGFGSSYCLSVVVRKVLDQIFLNIVSRFP